MIEQIKICEQAYYIHYEEYVLSVFLWEARAAGTWKLSAWAESREELIEKLQQEA